MVLTFSNSRLSEVSSFVVELTKGLSFDEGRFGLISSTEELDSMGDTLPNSSLSEGLPFLIGDLSLEWFDDGAAY